MTKNSFFPDFRSWSRNLIGWTRSSILSSRGKIPDITFYSTLSKEFDSCSHLAVRAANNQITILDGGDHGSGKATTHFQIIIQLLHSYSKIVTEITSFSFAKLEFHFLSIFVALGIFVACLRPPIEVISVTKSTVFWHSTETVL